MAPTDVRYTLERYPNVKTWRMLLCNSAELVGIVRLDPQHPCVAEVDTNGVSGPHYVSTEAIVVLVPHA